MMKKLLLLVTLFVSLAAQAYEPLVREDRIWDYGYLVPFPNYPSPQPFSVTFSGTTEINGVVYHNLTYVNNPEAVISLMREENKKVYRYIADDSNLWEMWNSRMDEAAQKEYTLQEGCNPGEILLYDFDREIGKTYMSLSASSNYFSDFYPMGIVSVSPQVMLRDGLHPQRYIGLVDEFNPDDHNNWVAIYDGIGPTRGLLDAPNCGPFSTCCEDINYILHRVSDKDTGKIIYNSADENGYIPMIAEGLEWEYDIIVTDADGSQRTAGSASYVFTDEVEKDGKKYMSFTDKVTGEAAAYMRQEGPAVYKWIDPETSQRPMDGDGNEITENRLYDFSISYKISTEDYETQIFSVTYPLYFDSGEDITTFVDALKWERIEPYSGKAQHAEFIRGDEWIGHAVFVEGVGPKIGRLFEPLAPIDGNNEKYVLKQLTRDGNVIYSRERLESLFTGIEDVNAEEPQRDARMYDLMGREIRNPQPGTIYIQNGEKRIAR